MNESRIAEPLGLINPANLKNGEEFLFAINYEMFPDRTTGAFKKNDYFIVHSKSWNPFKKSWANHQEEFPLESLPWIIDRFENGFWKTPEEGGLAIDEHCVEKVFNGERIGINPVAHCCAENLFGYSIWNASRVSYISKTPLQDWYIPRYMLLEQGIFARLKDLAQQYESGQL